MEFLLQIQNIVEGPIKDLLVSLKGAPFTIAAPAAPALPDLKVGDVSFAPTVGDVNLGSSFGDVNLGSTAGDTAWGSTTGNLGSSFGDLGSSGLGSSDFGGVNVGG